MGATILIVEDEHALCALLEYNLQQAGYAVRLRHDGDDALPAVEEERPDLVILDWMLPNVSGFEICRRLRANPEFADIPVIMLTARGEEEDRVRALTQGADDYIVKPFSISELIARIGVVLRRARPSLLADLSTFADITLDRQRRRVMRRGREVHLGPTEFRLLDCLLQRPGRVFRREQLLDMVWGRDVYVEARTVDVHVGRLRKALNEPGEDDPIRTVRSVGYALDENYGQAAPR